MHDEIINTKRAMYINYNSNINYTIHLPGAYKKPRALLQFL